ncbi:MAG: DUF4349 domain-containing protein [Gemmataceae bacterium]|nr:DUF4349 domain-containing protein [Gemmataceae bacterium]MCS7269520.1 DUF4349 domain-containing protein [Gemmataceae bacterium]MDW8242600.1 DUF4349 domain-containing protein [Thermogemmata sp.]
MVTVPQFPLPLLRWSCQTVMLLGVLALVGCSADVGSPPNSGQANMAERSVFDAPSGGSQEGPLPKSPPPVDKAPASDTPSGAEETPPDNKKIATEAERKIIYTAHLDVYVKDLDAAVAEVNRLTESHKGYVARSEVRGQIGQHRTAEYLLRVPVDNFGALRDALLQLGTAERNALESQDVTEEYVDVDARLRILKQEEEALNKMLREVTNRQDLLQTRQSLLEVRSQIERFQGRLNLLRRLSALATIHLKLREEMHYRPPVTTAAPTYLERVQTTFDNSLRGLVRFLERSSLTAVALVPWLPLIVPAGVFLVWLRRRWRARRHHDNNSLPSV